MPGHAYVFDNETTRGAKSRNTLLVRAAVCGININNFEDITYQGSREIHRGNWLSGIYFQHSGSALSPVISPTDLEDSKSYINFG